MALLDYPVAFSFALFVALTVAVLVGFRLAVLARAWEDESQREQVEAARDALGVSLSLLLGFSLALAVPKYDLRKHLVVDEANAIGTTILRAKLLPEPHQSTVLDLLRAYTEVRLEFSTAKSRGPEMEEANTHTKELQHQLWEQTIAVAQTYPNAITSSFVNSLNTTIDESEKRLAALENRIPGSVWIMLVTVAILTSLTLGYSARGKFWPVLIALPIMVSIVTALIADLDSARSGFLQTDLRPLKRLEQDLKSESSARSAVPPSKQSPTH
jgi:hypothetical protein